MPREKTLGKDFVINFAVLAIALGSIYVALKVWGPEELRAWIEAAGPLAPLALVAAKTATIVFAPLSGGFLYPLGGTLFGFWKGLALLALGDALGGTIAFWISRRYGRNTVERFLGNESGILQQVLQTMGTVRGFFITRLLLITAQDILAYAAGLTRLPYLPFIIIHASIGLIPTTILTFLGSVLLQDPTVGTFGIIFAATSVIGVISLLGFMWYVARTKKNINDSRAQDF